MYIKIQLSPEDVADVVIACQEKYDTPDDWGAIEEAAKHLLVSAAMDIVNDIATEEGS